MFTPDSHKKATTYQNNLIFDRYIIQNHNHGHQNIIEGKNYSFAFFTGPPSTTFCTSVHYVILM